MQYLLQAGLVDFDPEIGVLDSLPLTAIRAISKEVCSALSSPQSAIQLTTAAHVKWYLEAVGAAFSFPLEDLDSVQTACGLFCTWLSEWEGRPSGVKLYGEEAFEETILRLMSSLFIPRRVDNSAQTTGLLKRHSDLCKQAIQAITTFTTKTTSSLELKNKTIKIIIGISDSLLSLPLLPYSYMAEELSDDLMKMVWRATLNYEHVDEKSWVFLKTATGRWIHRPQVICHWQSITAGVCEAVVRKLYSSPDDRSQAQIAYLDQVFSVKNESFLAQYCPQPFHSRKLLSRSCRCGQDHPDSVNGNTRNYCRLSARPSATRTKQYFATVWGVAV
jgi:hypothetical protein